MVSAVGEGLLSGIGGALMGAEGYIQEETKHKRAVSLADHQHAKQLELEKLKQQYKQINKATDQGYAASLLGLESDIKKEEAQEKIKQERSPEAYEHLDKTEGIKAKHREPDKTKDPSWLTVSKGGQRVKNHGKAVMSDLAAKVANSPNKRIAMLGEEMVKAKSLDELKAFAGRYRERYEYAEKRGEDVSGLIPPKLWSDYVTDLDELLDTLDREVAQNGGIREDTILDRIDQLHQNPEYQSLFAEVPEEDDYQTRRAAALAAIQAQNGGK